MATVLQKQGDLERTSTRAQNKWVDWWAYRLRINCPPKTELFATQGYLKMPLTVCHLSGASFPFLFVPFLRINVASGREKNKDKNKTTTKNESIKQSNTRLASPSVACPKLWNSILLSQQKRLKVHLFLTNCITDRNISLPSLKVFNNNLLRGFHHVMWFSERLNIQKVKKYYI